MSERYTEMEPLAEFAVEPHGAVLTKLNDEYGVPILMKRAEIGGKLRGGCHVCLPNFGPDAAHNLAQHGFGRTVDWDLQQDEPAVKELVMQPAAGEYEGLQAVLRYSYNYESNGRGYLLMRLTLGNKGREALRTAPAFHPYFAVPEGSEVRLNGELLDMSAYAGTEYIEGTTHTLQIGRQTLTLHSDELTTWALWTDQAGDYFCVEPSQVGQSFENAEPSAEELLQPGELRTYDFTISWT